MQTLTNSQMLTVWLASGYNGARPIMCESKINKHNGCLGACINLPYQKLATYNHLSSDLMTMALLDATTTLNRHNRILLPPPTGIPPTHTEQTKQQLNSKLSLPLVITYTSSHFVSPYYSLTKLLEIASNHYLDQNRESRWEAWLSRPAKRTCNSYRSSDRLMKTTLSLCNGSCKEGQQKQCFIGCRELELELLHSLSPWLCWRGDSTSTL